MNFGKKMGEDYSKMWLFCLPNEPKFDPFFTTRQKYKIC